MMSNIADSKEAQSALEASEQQYEKLIEYYLEQAKLHKNSGSKYARSFTIALTSIVLFLYLILFAFWGPFDINNLVSGQGYLIFTSIFLAMTGLIIWGLTLLKDKMKEERVLKTEYEHKKQFINVFVGYMKEIEKLDVENSADTKTALNQLYNGMIDAAKYNPSLRIKTKGSEHLMQSATGIMKKGGAK